MTVHSVLTGLLCRARMLPICGFVAGSYVACLHLFKISSGVYTIYIPNLSMYHELRLQGEALGSR
jgi:hypothetical protein